MILHSPSQRDHKPQNHRTAQIGRNSEDHHIQPFVRKGNLEENILYPVQLHLENLQL